jgi:pimeloyl-ACP methyl ester carboxylesterase
LSVRIGWERHGSGAPLLLIHGLGYARWGWEPVLPDLAERFDVILFDNRGIGESDSPPGPYTAREMAEDAVQVLDEAGVERAHVIGASLGGMIAQCLAVAHPERVERLVLCCTTPGGEDAVPMPEVTTRLFAEAAELDPAVALRRFVENALGSTPPEGLVDELFARRVASPPDPEGWQSQAAAGLTFQGVELERIGAPTLVLHGTEDNVVDRRNADLLAERIPDARARLLPGTGHMFFWEQPGESVRLIAEFLE